QRQLAGGSARTARVDGGDRLPRRAPERLVPARLLDLVQGQDGGGGADPPQGGQGGQTRLRRGVAERGQERCLRLREPAGGRGSAAATARSPLSKASTLARAGIASATRRWPSESRHSRAVSRWRDRNAWARRLRVSSRPRRSPRAATARAVGRSPPSGS